MQQKEYKNLSTFRSEVIKQVIHLQHLGGFETSEKNKTFNDMKKQGCAGLIFGSLFDFLIPHLADIRRRYENYEDYGKKADELMNRGDIRTQVCQILKNTSHDPLEIAYLISPLFYKLMKEKILSIEIEPPIVALISVKISSIGIGNYCPVGVYNE
jgi:hypothetical protein